MELKKLLSANGYQPVESEPCDLILMDVNLPGESGFTLCRKLRQTSDTPRDLSDSEGHSGGRAARIRGRRR
mgnify:FL=1